MYVLAESSFILCVTLAALIYCGYGLTRLILPRRFASEGLLWMPLTGYTAMAIVFHFLNVHLLDGRRTAVVLLAAATLVNVLSLALRRRRLGPSPRTLASIAGIVAVVYFLGIAPLFGLGTLTAVGKSLDVVDVYDATAAYVMDYPVDAIAVKSPPNPLALKVASPSTLSNGWGYSYLQALASILTGLSPVETQAPTMSLVHALLAPAMFIFSRRLLRLRPAPALVISGLAGGQALILAMLLHGLGNHTVALATLPIILASSILALTTRRPRDVVFAGFMLTNIPLSYWAAFPYYVAPVAFFLLLAQPLRLTSATPGLALAFATRGTVGQQIIGGDRHLWAVPAIAKPTLLLKRALAAVAVVLISIVLGIAGYQRMLTTAESIWAHRHAASQPLLSGGWGGNSFISLANLTGLSYWVWPSPPGLAHVFGPGWGTALGALELAAIAVACIAAAYGLWRLPRRARVAAASLCAGFAAVLLATRLTDYFYAYLKTLTFAALIFIPLAVFGLYQALAHVRKARLPALRGLTIAGGALCLATFGLNTALTEAFFVNQPDSALTGTVLPPRALQLQAMAEQIPEGSSVLISHALTPELVSPAALFLRGNQLYGDMSSLESHLDNPPPLGLVPDFGVLPASEDPTDDGYQQQGLVWQSGDVKLYRRQDIVAHLAFTGQNSRQLSATAPLAFTVTQAGIQTGPAGAQQSSAGVTRQLVLELGALQPADVAIDVNGKAGAVHLQPGVSRYTLAALPVPAHLSITAAGDGGGPVFVRAIDVLASNFAPPSLLPKPDVLMALPSVHIDGQQLQLDVRYSGGASMTDSLQAGVSAGGLSTGSDTWTSLGWWGFDLRDGDTQITLDLASRDGAAHSASQDVFVNHQPEPDHDGQFSLSLDFWQSDLSRAGWVSPFYDLMTFRRAGGRVSDAQVSAEPVIFLPLRYSYSAGGQSAAAYHAEAAQARAGIPAHASLFLSPSLARTPGLMSALASDLHGPDVHADVLAGAQYAEASAVYDFALLAPSDDPRRFGYEAQDQVLQAPDLVLYRRGAVLSHLNLAQGSTYPALPPGDSRTFYLGSNSIEQTPLAPEQERASRQLVLALGSLANAAADIQISGLPIRHIALPAGLTQYRTAPVATPAAITIRNTSAAPLYLVTLDLTAPTAATEALTPQPDSLLVRTDVTAAGDSTVHVQVQLAGGGAAAAGMVAGITVNGNAIKDGSWFQAGWWGAPVRDGSVALTLDLADNRATASAGDRPVPVESRPGTGQDGYDYGLLSLWQPDLANQGWSSPFLDLFRFTARNGQAQTLRPVSPGVAVIDLKPRR